MEVTHDPLADVALPTPLMAHFPDGGAPADDLSVSASAYQLTAHPGGILRVWRIEPSIGEWAYYPVQVVGMTQEEIERALDVACHLLSLSHNRKARRARAVH